MNRFYDNGNISKKDKGKMNLKCIIGSEGK
jgi:hypothetical protein